MGDYYQLLGLAADASHDQIKQAFRRQARLYHPDLHPDNPEAAEKFRQLRRAYEVLIDTRQRSAYDRERAIGANVPVEQSSAGSTDATSTASPKIAYVRGVEKLQQQDYLAALTHFGRALELDPHFDLAYLKRCEVLLHLGRDRDILEDCQSLLKLQPDSDDAYYYRGRARQHLGYLQAAIQAYTQALNLGSKRRDLYFHRGNAYNESGNRRNALRDWRRYAELCERHHDERGYRSAMDILARYGQQSTTLRSLAGRAIVTVSNHLAAYTQAAGCSLREPVGGILPAFIRVGTHHGALAGCAYVGVVAGSVQACWLWGNLPPAVPTFKGWTGLGFAFIPFAVFWGTGAIATFLSGNRSFNLNAGAFMAGAALLPLGGLALVSIALLRLGWPLLTIAAALFAACWLVLALYGGYTRLLKLPETTAAIAVPSAIATSAGLIYLVLATARS